MIRSIGCHSISCSFSNPALLSLQTNIYTVSKLLMLMSFNHANISWKLCRTARVVVCVCVYIYMVLHTTNKCFEISSFSCLFRLNFRFFFQFVQITTKRKCLFLLAYLVCLCVLAFWCCRSPNFLRKFGVLDGHRQC